MTPTSFDDTVATGIITGNNVSFEVVEGLASNGSNVLISALVEDLQLGCVETLIYPINLCGPITGNSSITMRCLSDGTAVGYAALDASACSTGAAVDWDTFEVVSLLNSSNANASNLFTLTPNTSGELFVETATATSGTYTLTWKVKDSLGISSNTSTVTIVMQDCLSSPFPQAVVGFNSLQTVNEDLDAVVVDMTNYIKTASDAQVDWSTFSIVNTPRLAGATSSWNAANRTLTYTPNGGGMDGADAVDWTVSTTDGYSVGTKSLVVHADENTTPSVSADAACVVAGANVTTDVLSNDGANADPQTLTITTNPTFGSAAIVDEQIQYTSIPDYSGSVQIGYTVKDDSRTYTSAEATLTVTVITAGEDVTSYVCK